jgi:hypothetical protein
MFDLTQQNQHFIQNWWLQPYIPHSINHSAYILADHVDFWEEETFRDPNGWYRPRELTTFLENGSAADKRLKPRFRELLELYIELAQRSFASSDPFTDIPGFHDARRCNVQIAITNIRNWFLEDADTDEEVRPGRKRPREETSMPEGV